VTCRNDVADGFLYRFCPDDPPRAADRLRAVVRWQALDEITGEPAGVDFTITTSALGLWPRISADGIMGLVGNPARLYPGLDAATVQIPFRVTAPGYLRRDRNASLGPVAGFPDAFTPADEGVLAMHRAPFVLRGRVVQLSGIDATPLAGATVRLQGVWSTPPPYNVVPDTVIEPPNQVSLAPGLYADRVSATDGIRRRDLVLAAGEEKQLVLPAAVGDTAVRVSDCKNLSVGDLLAFEAARPDRVEYVTILAIKAGAVVDEPATLTLTFALQMAHEEGTACVRATPQAPAANNPLSRDGIPGERVAFATALSGLADNVVVEIGGGAAPVEYQTARLYSTTADVDGYYRLPPLSRVAALKLHIDAGALTPQEPVISPDYRRYENPVDVVFP
jgi:hypothetical protein